MDDYLIATDATIDLSGELCEQLGVKVIPMRYMLDGQEYSYDPVSEVFDSEDFYGKLKKGLPISTTQITPATYKDFFGEIIKISKKIVYICFSSGLSGTYNSAVIAADEIMDDDPECKIIVIDSVCACAGEGLLVYLSAQKKKEGMGFEEMAKYVEETKSQINHWFVVGNLDQLKRGGRINAVEATIGNLLSINPILSIDPEGKLKVVEKVRGMKKALNSIKERYIKYAYKDEPQTVMIAQAGAMDYANILADMVRELEAVKEIIICDIGPIIGAHVGSPMCALIFKGENYKE